MLADVTMPEEEARELEQERLEQERQRKEDEASPSNSVAWLAACRELSQMI